MKYAVCILAHNNPRLLNKIVERIKNEYIEIYVHVDKKVDLTSFLSVVKNATFIDERVEVYWGGRSMVKAMYNLINYVVNKTNCDYIIFISGQDFPIIRPDNYKNVIDLNKNYMEYKELPRMDWYAGGMDRVKYFYLFNRSSTLISRIFVKIQKIFNMNRVKVLNEIRLYGGSQWININRLAAETILKNWSKYYNFYRFTHIPDEMIFQTILLNSDLSDTIVNTNLRYIVFSDNKPNPIYLDSEHFPCISNTNLIFCRKIIDENTYEQFEEYFNNVTNLKGSAKYE